MTPKSHTTAAQVRELGLSVGDVIVGRENWGHEWSDAELTLLFVGKEVAVFSERNRSTVEGVISEWPKPKESTNWSLQFRDWVKGMTTTIEMAAWLDRQSKMASKEKCPKAAAQLDTIAQRLRELDKPDCVWTFDEDLGMYDTKCGEAWMFSEGSRLAENSVKFCPFCAGQVKEST